jgi:GT2 family glycosyltransferase
MRTNPGRAIDSTNQTEPGPIVVIGVSYETDELALRFVRRLSAITEGDNISIILVDNSTNADSTEFFFQIHSENADVLCIKPARNLGYFGAASFVFEQCLGVQQDYNWLVVSNVDVEFHDPSFFSCLRGMKEMDTLGVVAPSIWSNTTHRDQNPFMLVRPTAVRMKIYGWLYRGYYALNLYRVSATAYHLLRHGMEQRFLMPLRNWAAPSQSSPMLANPTAQPDIVPIYAAHGSCMIFARQFFARGGTLELPLFLYGEEVCIAEMVRDLGLRTVYNPSLKVAHNEYHASSLRDVIVSRQAAAHLSESTRYLVDAYFR